MSKTAANKKAWEQAYEHRNYETAALLDRLCTEKDAYLHEVLKDALREERLNGKRIVHFFCNNGRELLSICKNMNAVGTGYDIAENMVADANAMAKTLGLDANFIAEDIQRIDTTGEKADLLLITVGSLGWIKDLDAIFKKAYDILKPGARMLIFEIHPVSNMLAASGEDNFNASYPYLIVNNYFEKKEWISDAGMPYMSTLDKSLPFYDYSYTLSDLFTSILKQGFTLSAFNEFEDDAGAVLNLKQSGIPLSMLIKAKRA